MPRPQGGKGGRVLFVDDDARLVDQARRFLSAAGYDVSCAADAGAALASLSPDRGEVDLLIADVVLPDLSGLDLARRFKQLQPRVGVLMVSGYSTALDHAALPEGALFLPKPFTPEELLLSARKLLDGRE